MKKQPAVSDNIINLSIHNSLYFKTRNDANGIEHRLHRLHRL
jgi:hypothetical protein